VIEPLPPYNGLPHHRVPPCGVPHWIVTPDNPGLTGTVLMPPWLRAQH